MERMLTDEQWALIAPLLPPQKPRGRKRADDRQTLEDILWVLKTGSRPQDLTRGCGSKTRYHRRLKEWQEQGVWERLWRAFLSTLGQAGRLQGERAFMDATFLPAKRGREGRADQEGEGEQGDAGGRGAGPSPGGAGGERPEGGGEAGRVHPGPGEGDKAGGEAQDKAQGGGGRPGYDSEALRRRLRARGIKPCIPRRRNARPRRGRKPDLSGYRQRWVVERTFAWLGGFRRLVVRWKRRAHISTSLSCSWLASSSS
jgi:transposase